LKAAILSALSRPLDIVGDLAAPPLRRGQVLVKLAYSGVCHSQLMEVRGKRGVDAWLPHLLGHEGSGVVMEVGEGVSKVQVGDKVILGWIKGQGIEAGGAAYSLKGQHVNAGGVTTFNEAAVCLKIALCYCQRASRWTLPCCLAVPFPPGQDW
jgi:S-(hydroxymethyl)glutathione dehydrogenase / alcohol dehydrogenase